MTTTHARTIIGEEHWEEFLASLPKEPTYTYSDGTPNYYVWAVLHFIREKDVKV